ncbi:uncharacterized protein LOC128227925 isoform X2 [Mya arenaria]|uniref:uncharacterized protein LOC128227925 isoform X2 n=1 Tax=Mya arenaria TaxID=6604 RepID=UPI0022E63E4C|nr:uncharacterized protein LOC128227925 isoform X2 [Mya arenaria]
MATTNLPPTLGAATSQYKIRCKPATVLIGDREYLSATDALEAYLGQYERQGLTTKPAYKRTVNDLLNPKSSLHLTAERSLDTGIRATDTELRLADQKEAVNESLYKMKKSVALKAEVDEALNKSQELIKQINADNIPKTIHCPSDVGSLTTDILVSMNPLDGYSDNQDPGAGGVVAQPTWKSKHVFGYKRPRNRRSKTLSSLQIAHDMMGLIEEQPNQSFTAQPHEKSVTFQTDMVAKSHSKYDDEVSILLGESPNTSRHGRSPNKSLRERSRSVSPSILKRERHLFESGLRNKPIPDYYTDFNSSAAKAPSWIDTMNLSDVSDTDWKKRDFTVSKPPPSWVNDIDNSDITSVISAPKPAKKLAFEDLLRPLPVINTQQNSSYNSDANDTLPAPGLTYKDLLGDTSQLANTPNKQRSGSPTLSEKLTNLKTKTNEALKRYHHRVQQDIDLDTPSRGSNPYSGDGVPRCSSLDTAALIAGIPPLGNDISGASPIKPARDNDSTITARGSPGKDRRGRSLSPGCGRGRSRSPDTDIVLEGDRPWEKTVSYKPPVLVSADRRAGNDAQNYSGGSQPGSLEALKNMIFKLQQEAVTTDSEDEGSRSQLSAKVSKLKAEAANLGISVPVGEVPEGRKSRKQAGNNPTLEDYDFQGEPGGQSLEKALVHLDRLKTLVNTHEKAESNAGVIPLCANTE